MEVLKKKKKKEEEEEEERKKKFARFFVFLWSFVILEVLNLNCLHLFSFVLLLLFLLLLLLFFLLLLFPSYSPNNLLSL